MAPMTQEEREKGTASCLALTVGFVCGVVGGVIFQFLFNHLRWTW